MAPLAQTGLIPGKISPQKLKGLQWPCLPHIQQQRWRAHDFSEDILADWTLECWGNGLPKHFRLTPLLHVSRRTLGLTTHTNTCKQPVTLTGQLLTNFNTCALTSGDQVTACGTSLRSRHTRSRTVQIPSASRWPTTVSNSSSSQLQPCMRKCRASTAIEPGWHPGTTACDTMA